MALTGTTIGGIRCGELLGQGGMGQVYLGVDERLDRRVALKVMRPDTRADDAARVRFRREARTLSQVEHPNVCRLYDLVERDNGDVLVLEYVEGEDLASVLERGLGQRDRVAIAEQVAEALAAAHAMSVIHRDLKPDNIRITRDGGVKVLDFGLARPVSDEPPAAEPGPVEQDDASCGSPGGGSLTALGDLVGTPRYMSPEQARGEHLTAASDMYSFGLLLQELLTGRSPVGEVSQRQVLVRRLRWGDTEPVRGVPAALAQLIRRLLALAPGERPSAVETVAVLRRFRERPRRRLLAVTTGVAVLSLLAGITASSIGYLHARSSLERANQAQAQTVAVNEFLRGVLESAQPSEMGIDVKVVEVLDAAGARVDEQFSDHPRNLVAVHGTMGSTYLALGIHDRAEQHLRRAVAIGRERLDAGDADTVAALYQLGLLLARRSHWQESETVLEEVIAIRQLTLGPDHPDTLTALSGLAGTAFRRKRFVKAEELYRQVLEARRRVLGEDHLDTVLAGYSVGRTLAGQERWEEAEALLASSLERLRQTAGEGDSSTLGAANSLASLYFKTGRMEEARTLYGTMLESTRRLFGPDHPNTLIVMKNLGALLLNQQRGAEAEQLLREVYERARSALGENDHITLHTTQLLGIALHQLERVDEAEALYHHAVATAREAYGDDHLETWARRHQLARFLAGQGRRDEAVATMRDLLERRLAALGEEHPIIRSTATDLAVMLRDFGRTDEAETIAARHGIILPTEE